MPDKSFSLYKGTVTVDYWDQYHRYEIRETGVKPLSVTAVTGLVDKSGPLIYWAVGLTRDYLNMLADKKVAIGKEEILIASKLHLEKKKAAATSGSLVHAWAEDFIKGRKPDMPTDQQVANGVLAFLKWVDEHEVKFEASEQVVYSKKHGYVGLLDARCTMKYGVNGEKENHKIRHLTDFKTSKGFYDEQYLQVSAYQEADAEESGREYGSAIIAKFDKQTAEFEARETADHKQNFEAFKGLLVAKKRLVEMKKGGKQNDR